MNKYLVIAGAALVTAAVAPSIGSAQSAQSDQWLAWQGCWHAEGDDAGNLLCVVPEGAGVRMISLSGGAVQSESRIIADGQSRQVTQEGCSGTERANWSSDRTRLFLHSDQTCGAGISRKVSGIIALVSPSRWVTVQSVNSGGNQAAARVMQYSAVEPTNLPENIAQAFRGNRLARETARVAAAARIDLADVREAVGMVDAGVVENWLTATSQTFDIDARKLVDLADNGVPGSVIDALVAVSNPKHFEIRTGAPATLTEPQNRRDTRPYAYDCDPLFSWLDYGYYGYCNRYGRYGGYYGYSPYGYDYYRWGFNSSPIIIIRGGDDDGSEPLRPKATRNGYSSGRSSTSGSSTAGRSSSGNPSSTTSASGSGSSGSSSSGSGSTTTRTAKPRGGS